MVAYQDVGPLGASASEPVAVRWHWTLRLPPLLMWVVVPALLLLPGNWHGQAWLILVPLAVVAVALSMLARLFSMPDEVSGMAAAFLLTVAVAWSAVFLLAHRLSRLRPWLQFLCAFGLMLVVGAISYAGRSEFQIGDGIAYWIGFMAGASFALLAALTLSRYCEGSLYRYKPLMAWLLLWTVIISALSTPIALVVTTAIALLYDGMFGAMVLMVLMQAIAMAIAGGFLGFALYLVSLPFMLLADRSPLYRGRLLQVLRFEQPLRGWPVPGETGVAQEPVESQAESLA